LNDEPVLACPLSAGYRLRRFARKNRRLLATAAALGTLLVVATMGAGIAAVQSSRLADREQELRAAAEQRADLEAKGRDELNQKLYLNRIALAQQELYAQNIGRAHELLDECPASLRGWEWRFLKRFRLGNPLTLPDKVDSATFSPDGRFLATRRNGNLIDILNCETGEKIRTLQASSTWIDCYGLDFCRSDGETLLAVGDAMGKVVKIWNVDTGEEQRTLEGHAARLRSVAFSPDGRHLAAGSISGGAKVWDWKSGQIVYELPRASVSRFAYSPDGRRLAMAVFESDHGVELLDAATGREIRAFGNHYGGTESVAYHPHAPQLATCGNDGTVKIWDEATGTLLRTLRGHNGPVKDVVFTPDGRRLVSAGWDKTLKIWEVKTGQETLTLRGHVDTVMKLEFSRDGDRLISTGLEDAKIWDARPGDDAATLGVMSVLGHSSLVTSVAFSPNGRLLATADADRLINVWNLAGLAQGRLTLDRSFQRDPDIGVSIAFSPDSRRLASTGWVDACLQVWDTETSRSIIQPVHKSNGGRGLAFSPDGTRIGSTGPGAIGEYDAATGETLWRDKALGNMNSLAYSPDGKYLAVSNHRCVSIRDRESSKELITLEHPAIIWGVAFSPDSQGVVTACFDHSLRLWDPTNGRELREFRGHTDRTICVAFSPDGQRLASGGDDSTVKVWDVASGRELVTLRGHRGCVWSVAFSPNGAWLSSAGGHAGKGEVKIWMLANVLEAASQPAQLERARRHAVEFYRLTAAAQPKVWEHQRNLGQACIQAQHWDEATLAYSAAIELNSSACPDLIAALMAKEQDAECRIVVRRLITAVERMSNDQPDRADLRRAREYTSQLLLDAEG
jgi:eukaryotic-like serine/threonine-protein kinase